MSKIDRIIDSLQVLYLELDLQLPDPKIFNNRSAKRIAVRARMSSNHSLQFVTGKNDENDLTVRLIGNESLMRLQVESVALKVPIDVSLNERVDGSGQEENSVPDLIMKWIHDDGSLFVDLWTDIQKGRIPNGLRRILK